MTQHSYIWVSSSRHPERRGMLCRIVNHQNTDKITATFEDGTEIPGVRSNVRIFSVANAKKYLITTEGVTKKCIRCGKEKDRTEFYNNKRQQDGREPRCKQCCSVI